MAFSKKTLDTTKDALQIAHCPLETLFLAPLQEGKLALSAVGRKHLLPHGASRKIARRLGIEESRVSVVLNGQDVPVTANGWKSYSRVQKAIAKALNLTVEEAFAAWERGEEIPQEMAS